MLKNIFIALWLIIIVSCNKNKSNEMPPKSVSFVRALDISSYPEIRRSNPVFYDRDGSMQDFITLLKNYGVNTIRLRLWVNPPNGYSGFHEVKQFSEELKNDGFKIWLTLHYSDTWADPGHQQMPALWETASFDALRDSVYAYTKRVVCQIQPDYIQIGNEINSGFLHPYGNINNFSNFKQLLQKGISAVRDNSNNTKIVLHYAGFENASWFFQQVNDIDYDMIGLSYYPIWHGKSITNLKDSITSLSISNHKEVIIAETAYPFTLNWNDWTNNIVGLESQLILPDFPATETGQKNFVNRIHTMLKEIPNNKGIGFCYWGGELIAWRGNQATDGSAWENQALFNFQNQALPALEAFKAK